MMTPGKLFFQRLISEWKYDLSVWRTVIDWTVALYLVIPFLGFVGYQYLNWWSEVPWWLLPVPFELFLGISLLFAWSGTIRMYLREADQLFLWNRSKWFSIMLREGIVFYGLSNVIKGVIFFILLAPFLIKHYQMDIHVLILFGFITYLTKMVLGLLRQLITLKLYGFKQWLILRTAFVFSSFLFIIVTPYLLKNIMFYILVVFTLALIICVLINKRLKIRGSFFADLERESRERLKYVTFLLKISGVSIKEQKRPKKRPWLFRSSNVIFRKRSPVNALVEFGIKSVLRNRQKLQQHILFILICISVILGFPTHRWLIWLILSFILTNFVGVDWKDAMNSDLIKIFQWKRSDQYLASYKYLYLMTLPGFLLISIITSFQSFSWVGAVAALPVSTCLVFFMSKIVSSYI